MPSRATEKGETHTDMVVQAKGLILSDRVNMRNALVTVADKAGLGDLVQAPNESGMALALYSTGGMLIKKKKLLAGASGQLSVASSEDYARYPEMPGGLVKTLHPRIHGGLLGAFNVPVQA